MDSNWFGRTLYLAYPCSVDAGIDPVLVIKVIRQNSRYQDNEIRRKTIYKSLCHMCNCNDSIKPKELIKKARGMRTLWGYATAQDRTMMGEDAEKVETYVRSKLLPAPEPQFIEHPFNIMGNRIGSRVISEVDNERISDLRGYLIDGQGSVKFLYLSGHGLSPSIASSLANCPADDETSKSAIWPWDLRRCMETMEKTPSEITREAKTGDIVVFSSGLLTPEWVIDRIRDSESHARQNTIIIVVDSCYSGMWRNRIITELQNSTKTKLKYARIILQTSCSHNEVSYGDLFTPLFCWLQHWGETIRRNGGVSAPQNSYLFRQQSPTFYDSIAQQSMNQMSVNVIKYQFGSKNFYFFNDSRIFYKAVALMCSHRDRRLVRGIPTDSIREFFNSIYANLPKKPKIISCKLKTIRNRTPMALFLVEWKNSFYHLHLHFKSFNYMVISKITHVDVTKQSDIYRTQFTETGNKEYINSGHPVWVYIDCEQFANYCKEFMEKQKVYWTKRSNWNMTDTKPSGMIRSRCANLKIKLLTHS